jgi:hypothetical protein
MASELKIRVNEREWKVAAAPDTPLLYVLSNSVRTRFTVGRQSARMESASVTLPATSSRAPLEIVFIPRCGKLALGRSPLSQKFSFPLCSNNLPPFPPSPQSLFSCALVLP